MAFHELRMVSYTYNGASADMLIAYCSCGWMHEKSGDRDDIHVLGREYQEHVASDKKAHGFTKSRFLKTVEEPE